jgi:GT2 family glycosyltransferase
MSKISIVSPYFNRKPELIKTLKVMRKSSVKDFEYILIDDASSDEHRIEDLVVEFPFIKLTRINPNEKKHINPCIPFNMGIAKANGDIIILQSPECLHVGDVIDYALNNTKQNQYVVFPCFSLSPKSSSVLNTVDFNMENNLLNETLIKRVGGLTDFSAEGPAGRNNSWFSHPTYRKCLYNFLVALTVVDLHDLGGFNEGLAFGHGYDDTDFVARVIKKGMEVLTPLEPFCLHQHHRSFLTEFSNFKEKETRNRLIYEKALLSQDYKVTNSFIGVK